MPQALEVDKEAIKMVAIQVGFREAARQFGIAEGTLTSWATREGWTNQVKQVQEAQQLKVVNQGMQTVAATSPVDVMVKLRDRSKLRLSHVIDKTALGLKKKTPEELIKLTNATLNTTNAWAKLHGEQAGTTVNLAVQVNANQVPEA